ncbi:MAG TPA: mechanosensitive ion channel family protein [Vicinamibacteria bacterium]|nr:mechanosensitive ion channel family protein [Vicinamibacteria bacterium]
MFWTQVFAEARADHTAALFGGVAGVLLLARLLVPAEKGLRRGLAVLFGIHLGFVATAGLLRFLGSAAAGDLQMLARVVAAVCAVKALAVLLFRILLPWLRLSTSRILQDVMIVGASVVAVFYVASHSGVNLSGLIATSAVLTGVIGFALHDTLGNVIGGLQIQTDKSIRIGDWIKVGDVSGKVVDIRWRFTAVETRNWETLLIPNSVLLGERVYVLGRRTGQPVQWRRWVYFNVDFRHPPNQVIRVALDALSQVPIENVAAEPPPQCVLMDLHESYARYAVRYWLTDLAIDDPTDSVVRTRVYFALKRAGIPLSLPAHAVFLTEESSEREERKLREERERRLRALGKVEILRPLPEEERVFLAESLHYAPFAAGEVLTRQGAEGHYLYLILEGEVSVRVTANGGLEREVARLKAGDFFGEMSLMTGERRSATVVAEAGVECFRLDKPAFEEILRRRPEVAEPVAEILARRRLELAAVREGLDQEAQSRRLAAAKGDLLARIRDFFGLDQR